MLLSAAAQQGGAILGLIFPFVFFIGLFYIMIILPEKKRKKKYNEMLNSLKVNDEVLTKGGVIGRIITIKDNFVIVESGPDRSRIKFDKSGILEVLSSKSEATEVKEDKEPKAKEIK